MQDSGYINEFQSPKKIDSGHLLEGLTAVFAKYEVPIGLVNKLLALSQYKLNFIIDDSGSMGQDSDALLSEASSYIKNKKAQFGYTNLAMTRWEEAEDRLHIMIDMLAFVPTGEIKIHFLNRPDAIILNHQHQNPNPYSTGFSGTFWSSQKQMPKTPDPVPTSAALARPGG